MEAQLARFANGQYPVVAADAAPGPCVVGGAGGVRAAGDDDAVGDDDGGHAPDAGDIFQDIAPDHHVPVSAPVAGVLQACQAHVLVSMRPELALDSRLSP